MKKLLYVSVCILITVVSCKSDQRLSVPEITLSDQWKFNIGDDATWASPGFDDSEWITLNASQPWEDQGYPEYDGYAWYRQQINIPADWQKNIRNYGGLMIKYDNADDVDELFFNGHSIGITGTFPPEYKSRHGEKRKYIIPAEFILFDRPNTVAVRIYDGGGGGGLITHKTLIRPMNIADAVNFKFSFPAKEWVFMENDPQQLELSLTNTLRTNVKLNAVFILKTDKYEAVDSIVTSIGLRASEEKNITIPFTLPTPGFYRCTLYVEKDGVEGSPESFNIGNEPEKIISPQDAKPDFEEFWKQTRKELDKVKPNFKMTLLPELSTGQKNVYHVEMMSFGNVKIEGGYAVPKEKGVYPGQIIYLGYGSGPVYPHTDGNPGYAEFILSVRGQGIQRPDNEYNNEWITSGLNSKEDYYYRGAFMDLVRGIDFIASRPEVDNKRIVAEGGSQGGAFTMVACALDNRILAAAPTIPFLSDYRDYFAIAPWPRSEFERYLKNNSTRNWEEVYDLLTYFDVKNFAGWIECPIIMGVGLQDNVCPPHTNFAGYNLITSSKEYRVYHDQAHSTPMEWQVFKNEFFADQVSK